MPYECRHILPRGSKCKAPALRGMPFCYFHTRLHNMATRPRTPDEPLKLPVLEDRSAIQVALAQILDALGSSRIDPKQAGLFLYGLQIASQNVERNQDVVPYMAVQSMTLSSGGDELGPIISRCHPPAECSDCDLREICEDFNARSDYEPDPENQDGQDEEDEEQD